MCMSASPLDSFHPHGTLSFEQSGNAGVSVSVGKGIEMNVKIVEYEEKIEAPEVRGMHVRQNLNQTPQEMGG